MEHVATMEHFDMVSLIVDGLFTLVAFLGGFLLKAMWSAIDKLREDMLELNKAIARDYVRRDDFQQHATRVEQLLAQTHNDYVRREDFQQHALRMEQELRRLFDKLDDKADKTR